MTEEKLAQYKEALLEKKARIEEELSAIATKDKDSGEYEANYVNISDEEEDNAQEMVNYERDIQIEGTLEDTLDKIDRALERIEQGTYGKDIHTGEPIAEARLDILPEAEESVK